MISIYVQTLSKAFIFGKDLAQPESNINRDDRFYAFFPLSFFHGTLLSQCLKLFPQDSQALR